MCNTAKMFFFGPNPTREKKAWSSSTCLLYAPSPGCSKFKAVFLLTVWHVKTLPTLASLSPSEALAGFCFDKT